MSEFTVVGRDEYGSKISETYIQRPDLWFWLGADMPIRNRSN